MQWYAKVRDYVDPPEREFPVDVVAWLVVPGYAYTDTKFGEPRHEQNLVVAVCVFPDGHVEDITIHNLRRGA